LERLPNRSRYALPLALVAPALLVAGFSWWSALQFKQRYFNPILAWYLLIGLIACLSVGFGFWLLRGRPSRGKDWRVLFGCTLGLTVLGILLTNTFHVFYFPRF
jgi:hypothetical protein